MSSYQIVGLIQLLIGIVCLIFPRRIANFIRSVYTPPFGINISEWVAVTGLVLVSIIFVIDGLQMVFSPNATFRQ